MALHVAAPVQHEGREHQADEAERRHDGADVDGAPIPGQHHLEAQQRIERDVEQQAGQHGRDRRRAFRMGIGQPGMKRRNADLGAVADQQEHEGERQQLGIEQRGGLDQQVPRHRRQAVADHVLRHQIDEDGAEKGEPDADAAENEVFPRRLDRLGRAILISP
jgi:hypothetical protein